LRVPYTKIRAVRLAPTGEIERDCAPDEIGMLIHQGPGVTPGYVDPKFDRAAFTSDGWLISGDLGRIDADGYVWVTGRAKDLIIRGGHNIDPAQIEEALQQSGDVMLAAAVGKPDAHAGEVPVAYVQLVPGAKTTARELAAFAAERVTERAAAPKEVYIIEQMPLTEVGKPRKAQMRHDAARRAVLEALAGTLRDADVHVGDDDSQGTLATITLPAANDGEKATLQAEIDSILCRYTLAYRVTWCAPQSPPSPSTA
jgi:fatty-acyl-CoA synthase